ncbi:hypothetical protein [Pseudomonas saudimassiliensis]|uniref:hypothetical protein n=1 Tax=Pseudomonas saudimassiliensis TaxID=1461581 RepID=UPI000AC0A432|nr:hypothetical protein [Pseudomonas saudimassiliensis]
MTNRIDRNMIAGTVTCPAACDALNPSMTGPADGWQQRRAGCHRQGNLRYHGPLNNQRPVNGAAPSCDLNRRTKKK